MFGFAKTFAVAAVALAAAQATPAMAFGPGGFARSLGNDIQHELVVAEARSPAQVFEYAARRLSVQNTYAAESTISDFFSAFLHQRERELTAIRDVLKGKNGSQVFAPDYARHYEHPSITIQQIWL